RWSPSMVLGFLSAGVLAGVGLIFSRPDIVAMGVPISVWAVIALRRGRDSQPVAVTLTPVSATSSDGVLRTAISVTGEAEIAEVALVQSERRTRRLIIPVNGAAIVSRSRALHSGPVTAVGAS